jgi:hypothetical protein
VCNKREVWVEGFADACCKGEEDIACYKDKEVVVYCKGKKGVRRLKEVVASPVRVRLRQSQKDTIIISLSLTSVFASLLFV